MLPKFTQLLTLLAKTGYATFPQKAPFSCPLGCNVYTPSRTHLIQVENDQGATLTTLENLYSRSPYGMELPPGNYTLKSTNYHFEFTFYIVQKDAVNFDVPVYSIGGKVGVFNQRYVTYLSDMPGFRIRDISGDLSGDAVRVYTVGAQSVNSSCKPVYTSRFGDNAARSSLSIFGPIATVDFGSSKGMHYTTFSGDYSTVYTYVGASTIYVSPGYVGCGDSQLYANDYITKMEKSFHVEANELTGSSSVNRTYGDISFDISVNWQKQGENDTSQFAVQIDLLPKTANNPKL